MTEIQIQDTLSTMNYSPGEIDGAIGPITREAVKRAQAGYGIAVDGEPGPITQSYLAGQLSAIQSALQEKGYYNGSVDGVCGDLTDAAIKAFQSDNGLGADGIVGDKTSAALFETVAPAQEQPVYSGDLRYFGPDDFKCACGCGFDACDEIKNKADQVRDILGLPLIITSAARCEWQNEQDGGVWDSRHKVGEAFDCYTPGMSDEMVDRIAEIGDSLGLYTIKYYDQQFVHMNL